MEVEFVVNARISGRNNERLTFRRKTDMANKPFIQNSVDSLAIEMTTLWKPLELGAIGLCERHGCKYATDQYYPR